MKIKYKDKPQEIPVFVNVYRLQCRLARDLCPLEDKDKSTDKDKDKDKYKYDNMSTRPDQTRIQSHGPNSRTCVLVKLHLKETILCHCNAMDSMH